MATAWAGKRGALTSDRLRPPRTPTPPVKGKGKNQAQADPPKSERVRELETLLAGARAVDAGNKPDPHGGCFCLARVHPLSTYTPICMRCGLILCELNAPHYACPSCAKPLPMVGLVEKLEEEIVRTLAEEDAARVRAEEIVRAAAGAFPTLQAASAAPAQPQAVQPAAPEPSRKVMSLTGRNNVKMTSYAPSPPRTPTPGAAAAALEEAERRRRKEEEERGSRIARPPPEVVTRPPSHERWGDGLELGGGGVQYVGSKAQPGPRGQAGQTKRSQPKGGEEKAKDRKGKGKAKGGGGGGGGPSKQ